MGTYYRVTLVRPAVSDSDSGVASDSSAIVGEELDEAELKQALEGELERLNAIFSTYRDDSELQRFNQMAAGDCADSSELFAEVLRISRAVNERSNGRFNPAVMPLVSLWGFDREQRASVPSADEINLALRAVDFSRVYLSVPANAGHTKQRVCKRDAIELDFSAVAKGYAADHLAVFLKSMGYSRFLIDIGGELIGVGANSRGQSWKVAIERPVLLEPGRAVSGTVEHTVERILSLKDQAVATSGNYRNFFYHDGKRYVHTIDPQTGTPVEHGLLSATVVDASAAVADAWATALMASGVQRAKRLVLENDLQALLLVAADGTSGHSMPKGSAGKQLVKTELAAENTGISNDQLLDHYDQHEQGIVEAGRGDYTVWYPVGFEHFFDES